MASEAEFIAAIAANPDDDLSRLVFSDWLEENGQPERAEFIRLSCQLDPHRDRFDDDLINALRHRVEVLEYPSDRAERAWLESLHKPMVTAGVDWRRGFVESLELPVQWFLQYGEQFRARYPLLRKLVLFRLNGWSERLAACEWLQGIREIELACWYSDADAAAVANSSHLGEVERVVLWSGGSREQARLFARGTAWPKLRELHLVSKEGPQEEWVRTVNEAAGRPIATVYDFGKELFPFAADFYGDGFIVGKRADGTQLFAYGDESNPTADGWLFNSDGTKREPFRFEFPPELVFPRQTGPTDDWKARLDREKQMLSARKAYLMECTGFVPAFIRVEGFTLEACGLNGTHRYGWGTDVSWGQQDDPNIPPEKDESLDGHGGQAHFDVRTGQYGFDFGNELLCDRRGQVHST